MKGDQTKSKGKKTRKLLWYGLLILVAVSCLAQILGFAWAKTGSNQWELRSEKDGIKVWTMKTPKDALLKGKAVYRVQSTLGAIVGVVYDSNVHRANGLPRLTVHDTLRGPGYFSVYSAFTQKMPFPFKSRAFVLLTQHVQDSASKQIEFNAIAAPNELPPDPAYVRLTRLHNRYLLTPLSNGEVEVEFHWNIDLGGSMPYFLQNLMLPATLHASMSDFRRIALKYSAARLEYIQEPDQQAVSQIQSIN